jgi:hypothetical protein
MARKASRPYTPPPAQVQPDMGRTLRGGYVQKFFASLEAVDRRLIIEAIGLKACQRIGHRHKVVELRGLTNLTDQWEVVDAWITVEQAPGGIFSFGDLFDGLLRELVERAREILGDRADEPSESDMLEVCETIAEERSDAQAKLLLAVVVEFEFTAKPEALAVAAANARFAIPAE